RRNQELKHEKTSTLTVEVVGQSLQSVCLSPVECLVALRVVSYQYFAECRPKGFNVVTKVSAVLKIELILAALLDRTGDHKAVDFCLAQDGCALFRHPAGDCRFKAVIDDPFRLGDLRRLFSGQVALPSEHSRLERAAVVEGQYIQWPVESERHCEISFSPR